MSQPIIQARNLWKEYGEHCVLERLNISVNAGEFVTLVGASGCGKSTLIRLAAGLEPPDAGRVWRRENARLGVVFQQPRLLRSLTVEGNVLLGLGAITFLDRPHLLEDHPYPSI